MSVRIPDFYIFPVFGGPTLAQQYPNLRNSFGWLNAVMRNSYIDESTNLTTHVLNALGYGELSQRFKFRWRYDAANDEFQLQQNSTDNEANPNWITIIKIRESDGRVTITGTGGLLVTGGFYNFGGLDVAVTQTGGSQFRDVGTLLFDSNSGFYITPDSTGRPIVSVNVAAASGTLTDLANLGAGGQVFANKTGSTANLRSIVGGTNVTVTQNTNDLTISASDTGEVNTASNLGSGAGVWFDKQGVDLRFKSLTAGTGITLTPSSTEILIDSTGGGGGGFYGVLIKESEAGGFKQRDDEIVFDSAAFYVADNNAGKPLVSLKGNLTLTDVTANSVTLADLSVSDVITMTELTTNPSTPSTGQLKLWASDEVSNFTGLKFMDSSGRVIRAARDQIALVKNTSGGTLQPGQVVYIQSANATFANVSLAQSNSTTTMPGLAVVPDAIANNAFGIVYGGGLIDGLDLSAFTDGQVVYVSSSVAGGLTATEPVHPNLAQRMGVVVNSGASGSLLVLVDHAGGSESGTTRSTFTVGTTTATSVVLASGSTSQRTATFQDASGTVAYLTDVGPGFYGITIKESEAGGYVKKTDRITFDSRDFYITTAGDRAPLVSFVGPTVRETDGTPTLFDIKTFSFLRNHFYVEQGSNTREAIIALRDAVNILFMESEQAGYAARRNSLVFDSQYFYLDDALGGAGTIVSSTDQGRWGTVPDSNKGDGYTVTGTDRGNNININSTSPSTINLLPAASAGNGFTFQIKNLSTGTVTIDPAGAEGINAATTLTLGASQAARIWCTGTAWRANVSRDATRRVLTSALSLFVRTDGSDSNNGEANTAAGAFLTVQAAINKCYTIDQSGFDITINVAAGTYTGTVVVNQRFTGAVTILGDVATPANVIFSVSSGTCITSTNPGSFIQVSGIRFATTTSGAGLLVTNFGAISVTGLCDFNAIANGQLTAQGGGVITVNANLNITGGAQYHYLAQYGGSIVCAGRTVTLTGTPNFSQAFAVATSGHARLQVNGNTYSGSATGTRFTVAILSFIETAGAGATYFPGDVAGTTDATTFGVYN